jgi:hypothetical protein
MVICMGAFLVGSGWFIVLPFRLCRPDLVPPFNRAVVLSTTQVLVEGIEPGFDFDGYFIGTPAIQLSVQAVYKRATGGQGVQGRGLPTMQLRSDTASRGMVDGPIFPQCLSYVVVGELFVGEMILAFGCLCWLLVRVGNQLVLLAGTSSLKVTSLARVDVFHM